MFIQAIPAATPSKRTDNLGLRPACKKLRAGDLVRSTHRQTTGVVLEAEDNIAAVYFGVGEPHWYMWHDGNWSDTEILLAIDD